MLTLSLECPRSLLLFSIALALFSVLGTWNIGSLNNQFTLACWVQLTACSNNNLQRIITKAPSTSLPSS